MDSRGVIRMNILFITCVDMNGQAGDSTHVREFILNLSKVVDSLVVLSPTSGEDTRKIDNVKFKKARLIYIPFLMSHSFSIYAFIMGFYTVLTAKYDVIYERYSIFGTGCKLGKIFKIPCIVEVNGLMTDEQKMTGKLRRIITKFELKTFSQADTIVTVTAKIKEILKMDYGVPGNKIVVVENGANTDLFKPMQEEAMKEIKMNENCIYVGFSGSFKQWHGIEDLVRSAPLILKEVENTKFILVGNGHMKEQIVQMVSNLNLTDKFVFIDKVPYEEVPKYVNAFDVCVILKKKDIPGSPLKLWEYMACGKPVIATNTEDFKVLEGYNAGILVDPEKPEEVADAITTLLKNKDLREEMGNNGRRYVVENRSWGAVAGELEKVMKDAVK